MSKQPRTDELPLPAEPQGNGDAAPPEADKPKRGRRLHEPRMLAVDAIHRALDALPEEDQVRCLEWVARDYGMRLMPGEATT